MKEAMDAGAVIIDVLEESEYADGHIAGAIDIPIPHPRPEPGQGADTDKPVVVYCASGFRAALSARRLWATAMCVPSHPAMPVGQKPVKLPSRDATGNGVEAFTI